MNEGGQVEAGGAGSGGEQARATQYPLGGCLEAVLGGEETE